jgi:septal ring factor EnvC (AmiA/AmiB activator)
MKKKTNKRDLTERNAKAYNKKFDDIDDKFIELDRDLATIFHELEKHELELQRLEVDREAEREQLRKIMAYFQQYFTGKKK